MRKALRANRAALAKMLSTPNMDKEAYNTLLAQTKILEKNVYRMDYIGDDDSTVLGIVLFIVSIILFWFIFPLSGIIIGGIIMAIIIITIKKLN